MDKKSVRNQDSKKASVGPKGQPSKTNRKGELPVQISATTEPCSGSRPPVKSICMNSACRAVVSDVDGFCKRCSCYICLLFDDNKDPSLWLECASESTPGSCGLSCHIECALLRRKVGVVTLGEAIQLDGSYCCASCGRTSEILGCWKKQLAVAKECRRVDILCYRINLCFRLLNGTVRFQDLHQFVIDAKDKLEMEVGPLSRVRAARSHVSRLSVAGEVQALCNAALQKAEGFSATPSSAPSGKESSVPQIEGTSGALAEPDYSGKMPDTSKADRSPSTSNKLDGNRKKLPDLNDEAAPDEEDHPRDEADHPRDEADHRSGGSETLAQHGPNVEVPAVNSPAGMLGKRPASREAHDSDGTFVHITSFPAHRGGPGSLDQYLEVFRKLEREGHITKEFRRKLFTWFSLRSTEQERRVVNTYIQTLEDDPESLGEQLVDSFGDVVNNKKPRN
ncbi:putative chromatin regulator PHD family [Helianthus debilis subsp. tardiflorus]